MQQESSHQICWHHDLRLPSFQSDELNRPLFFPNYSEYSVVVSQLEKRPANRGRCPTSSVSIPLLLALYLGKTSLSLPSSNPSNPLQPRTYIPCSTTTVPLLRLANNQPIAKGTVVRCLPLETNSDHLPISLQHSSDSPPALLAARSHSPGSPMLEESQSSLFLVFLLYLCVLFRHH